MSSAVRDELGIAKAFMDLYARMAADPALLATLSMNLWLDYMRLWQSSWMKLLRHGHGAPVAEPAKGDSRFKDDDWSKNFLFDLIKQSYLIAARHIRAGGGERRGPAGGIGEEGRLLHPPVRRCALAVELPAHQPAGAARDGGERRPEPGARA